MPPLRPLALIATLALLYALTGVLGLSLATVGRHVTLLWAPAGLALGALVVFGRWAWPGVALGALVVNLWTGAPWPVALGISLGNTLEALIGVEILRVGGFRPGLTRLQDVGRFLLAVGVAPLAAATLGSLALALGGLTPLAELPRAAGVWWLGDATGALVVAPVLMTFGQAGRRSFGAARAAPAETAALVVVTGLAGVTAFVVPGPLAVIGSAIPFVVVFGAALRQGLGLASTLTAATAAFAVFGAVRGVGPLSPGGVADLGMTWAYVSVLGCAMLVVAAVLAELDAALARQRELEAAAVESQRLESLGLIAAGVAHDFNNLLQVILGQTSIAKDRGADPADLEPVEVAVDQAAALCSQLLAYAGRAPVRSEPVDLAAETAAVAGLLRIGLPPGVELAMDLADEPVVACDRSQLRQIVMNLVTNATEATRLAEGGVVRITTGASSIDAGALASARVVGPQTRPGAFGWVEVADPGPGMSPEVLARMFEPFFTTRFHGRGLGLAALAGAVRTHGGFVAVTTTPGAGTRIRVGLPRASGPPALPPDRAGRTASITSGASPGRPGP